VRAVRYTATKDPALRAEPEGVIDPKLSLISFWNGEAPVATLSYYACHPQSYYRTGVPSSDFPGIARFIRGQALPEALQVHFNGAGGNIGAGKYNDGDHENRMALAGRLAEGMKQAWLATVKHPLTADDVGWQVEQVSLPVAPHLDRETLIAELQAEPARGYISKADQLAWVERCEAGHKIDIACLRLGDTRVLHMPGELFVEYQLAAQAMRPDLHVAMAAYGEYGPGYIGTEVAYGEGGYETGANASNVAPAAEAVLMTAMRDLLVGTDAAASKSSSLRVPARTPQQAVESFSVAPGFEMQLVAAEPDVLEPILIAYDENAAMYVAEFLKFPAKEGKSDGPDGRIRRLQDLDGDGRYETSNVFAAGLAWPTGICPWQGGVFVVCAPDLWYLKDTDGDGVADVREKRFTGFGFTTEEGAANNLIWGQDQWIYGAGSNSGGEIVSLADPQAAPTSIRGRDFRFHPVSGEFQAISGSEQFGNTFDDWGNRFICQNSKPAVHVVFPSQYLARNPFLAVSALLRDTWKDTAVKRISPPEPWRLARTKMRLAEKPDWTGPSVEHDVFTACSGVTIYRGDAYPADMRGNLFVGEVQGNLVHRRAVEPDGVTFQTVRLEPDSEFVRSTDNWFRPANLTNAPDGTLHIVDMYREVIETPDSMPAEIIAQVDLHSGDDRGRIYRLAPIGFKAPSPPKLGQASTEELVKTLEHPNGWWRDTAGRLLFERQDQNAIEPLRSLLHRTSSPEAKSHILWTLSGLAGLTPDDVLLALQDSSPQVRELGIRLAERQLQGKVLEGVFRLVKDADVRVRFQAALSLGETQDAGLAAALSQLSRSDAGDAWMRTAILSSSLNSSGAMLSELICDEEWVQTRGAAEMLNKLATIVGGRNQTSEMAAVLQTLEQVDSTASASALRSTVLGLGEGLRRSGGSLGPYLATAPRVQASVEQLVRQAQELLQSETPNAAQAQQAFAMLSLAPAATSQPTLITLLDSRRSPAVQLGAVQALAGSNTSEVATAIVESWNGLSPSVRREAIEVLLSRTAWTHLLLDAVDKQRISASAIETARRAALLTHSDAELRGRAEKLFGPQSQTPRSEVINAYLPALSLDGDAARGQAVYQKNCMACHRLGNQGFDVGPNLATVQNRTADALLTQILDPNRDVLANYTQYSILTDSDRVVTGLIASESPTSLTLRRAEAIDETILRQNIEQITGSGKSIMPEGLEQSIDAQQMSDLLAFLLQF
jgi:putative membrane-bound dehydrogenase-like protein